MRILLRLIGRIMFWAGWPVWKVYFSFGYRTRILVVRKHEVLVVRGWLSDGKWGLPGGGLHRREEVKKGALRELFEETGIALLPKQLESLGLLEVTHYGITVRYHVFATEIPTHSELKPQWYEIEEVRWISQDELNSKTAQRATLAILAHWKERP